MVATLPGVKNVLGVLLALVLVVVGSVSASAASVQDPLFDAAAGNQQGLATSGRLTWVGYDAGGGNARIVTYTWDGTYVGTSALLPLGHAAELEWRAVDDHLYVANGGTAGTGVLTKVFAVHLDARGIAVFISKTYDYTALGANGMVTVDNATDTMYVIGGPNAGPWRVVPHVFGHADSPSFTVDDPGIILQGIGVSADGQLWIYVSDPTAGASNSRMDVFDLGSGDPVSETVLSFSGEGEGMAVNPTTGSVYVGARQPNRVMRLHLL